LPVPPRRPWDFLEPIRPPVADAFGAGLHPGAHNAACGCVGRLGGPQAPDMLDFRWINPEETPRTGLALLEIVIKPALEGPAQLILMGAEDFRFETGDPWRFYNLSARDAIRVERAQADVSDGQPKILVARLTVFDAMAGPLLSMDKVLAFNQPAPPPLEARPVAVIVEVPGGAPIVQYLPPDQAKLLEGKPGVRVEWPVLPAVPDASQPAPAPAQDQAVPTAPVPQTIPSAAPASASELAEQSEKKGRILE
jgi:hypothetical protein